MHYFAHGSDSHDENLNVRKTFWGGFELPNCNPEICLSSIRQWNGEEILESIFHQTPLLCHSCPPTEGTGGSLSVFHTRQEKGQVYKRNGAEKPQRLCQLLKRNQQTIKNPSFNLATLHIFHSPPSSSQIFPSPETPVWVSWKMSSLQEEKIYSISCIRCPPPFWPTCRFRLAN